MPRIIVITGGSSGMGQAMAQQFAAKGDTVYELSRHGQDNGNIRHLDCDLRESAQISAAFAMIAEQNSHIDLLINNAGIGVAGATEFIEEEHAAQLMQIDFFAAWLCIKQALPLLRNSKQAKIINISSVAAVYAIPFQSFYSAAKAAINAMTMALAIELKPQNIAVTALMPGDVHTGFTAARVKDQAGRDIYGSAIDASIRVMEKDEQTGMPPERVAAMVCRLAAKRRLKPLYCCGAKYKFFLFLGRLLPSSIINKILRLMYVPQKEQTDK